VETVKRSVWPTVIQKEEFVNRVMAFFRKLQLRQILTLFLAGILLIVSTACSGATTQGANPNNPAVQAGGANNPYKSGGDGYTNLNLSTDSKVNNSTQSGRDRASLPQSLQLVAANVADKESELLYPGAETPAGRAQKEAELPVITGQDFVKPEPGGLNQRNPDLGERLENRVEQAQEAFKEAASFVKDKADEAGQRPEAQSNPALHK